MNGVEVDNAHIHENVVEQKRELPRQKGEFHEPTLWRHVSRRTKHSQANAIAFARTFVDPCQMRKLCEKRELDCRTIRHNDFWGFPGARETSALELRASAPGGADGPPLRRNC